MASQEQMEQLLENLAATMNTSVDTIKQHIAETGEVPKGAASVLNVARQFVKDSGIEVIGEDNEEVQRLNESLPEFDPEDSNVIPMDSK